MPLIEAYTSAWTRAFDYEGRSTRAEFWWFVLANLIVSALVAVLISRLQGLYTLASLVVGVPLACGACGTQARPGSGCSLP